jgi:hypothetical protein
MPCASNRGLPVVRTSLSHRGETHALSIAYRREAKGRHISRSNHRERQQFLHGMLVFSAHTIVHEKVCPSLRQTARGRSQQGCLSLPDPVSLLRTEHGWCCIGLDSVDTPPTCFLPRHVSSSGPIHSLLHMVPFIEIQWHPDRSVWPLLIWQGCSSLNMWVFVFPLSTQGTPSRFSLSLSDLPSFTCTGRDPARRLPVGLAEVCGVQAARKSQA